MKNCTRCGKDFEEKATLWFASTKRYICPGCTKILEYLWDHNRKPFDDPNFWSEIAEFMAEWIAAENMRG